MRKMKTTKEIQSSVIKILENLPTVVDEDSPDVVQVGDKYYTKKGTKVFTSGGTYKFNESMNFDAYDVNNPPRFDFDFTSGGLSRYRIYLSYRGYWAMSYPWESGSTSAYYSYQGWLNQDLREIVVAEPITDEALLAFLNTNAILISGPAYRYDYEYVEVNTGVDFEALVASVPTDANIVEDEGSWQIQLEHDSNVLSLTDITPFVNTFQPKMRWNYPRLKFTASETDTETTFLEWYRTNIINDYTNIPNGTFVYISIKPEDTTQANLDVWAVRHDNRYQVLTIRYNPDYRTALVGSVQFYASEYDSNPSLQILNVDWITSGETPNWGYNANTKALTSVVEFRVF